VATHSRQNFVDVNVSGTLNLLEEARCAKCRAFLYTSTTSVFGDAMKSLPGNPAVWVTEELSPRPKNIYGVTKLAAENLCRIFHRNAGLPCLVLRTSRFFPEPDDDSGRRAEFSGDNLKVNELLFRRVDVEDIVSAHLLALEQAEEIGFDRFIISATTPFHPEDAAQLGVDAPDVVEKYFPGYVRAFEQRGWKMLPALDRVYDNAHARQRLGWTPRYGFGSALDALKAGEDFRSPLAQSIGAKGYHEENYEDGIYPVSRF